MSRRGILLAAALAGALAWSGPAAAQEPDSLSHFLDALADSSDAEFGGASVEFDTTGLDTLAENALLRPYVAPRSRSGLSLFPVLAFHRAQGAIVGGGLRVGAQRHGIFGLRVAYATDAKQWLEAIDYRRTLHSSGGPLPRDQAVRAGRIGDRGRLDLEFHLAQENLPFMPEHANPNQLGLGALLYGRDAQSIYRAQSFTAGLALLTGDWRLRAGMRDARETWLGVSTLFSVFGEDAEVPFNTLANDDDYTEPWADVAFRRRDWDFAGVLAARGSGDRLRLRAALGKSLRLGSSFKLNTQVEAGATAAAAPRQRRFELGGDLAVPSLPFGSGGTDHLLLGRMEIAGAQDVLNALHLPHPQWLVLSPSVFIDAGNAWDDAAGRDVLVSKPPGPLWRGAAGGGLSWRIGIPEPDLVMRLWIAAPIGPNSGDTQFNMSMGRTFDLLGKL